MSKTSTLIAAVTVMAELSLGHCPSSGRWSQFQCMDGSYCWMDETSSDCCLYRGGRAACPDSLPIMCNAFVCGGGDRCCTNVAKNCNNLGGVCHSCPYVTNGVHPGSHGGVVAAAPPNLGAPEGVLNGADSESDSKYYLYGSDSESSEDPSLGDELTVPELGYKRYGCLNLWDCSFNHCPVGAGGQCINGECVCDTRPNTCTWNYDCTYQCPLGQGGRCIHNQCVCDGAVPKEGQCIQISDCPRCPYGKTQKCYYGKCICEEKKPWKPVCYYDNDCNSFDCHTVCRSGKCVCANRPHPEPRCYHHSDCLHLDCYGGSRRCTDGKCYCNQPVVVNGPIRGPHGGIIAMAEPNSAKPNLGAMAPSEEAPTTENAPTTEASEPNLGSWGWYSWLNPANWFNRRNYQCFEDRQCTYRCGSIGDEGWCNFGRCECRNVPTPHRQCWSQSDCYCPRAHTAPECRRGKCHCEHLLMGTMSG